MSERADILRHPPHPQRPPLVFASILGADFTRIGEQCAEALEAGADALHVDVMDGHFVPNLTMGPWMVRSLRRRFPDVYLDVHLMVERPEQFIQPFAEAGADGLTFHIEATLGRRRDHERDLIGRVRSAGCRVGIAINPPTPAESIAHILGEVDLALVMSVHPGFAGQRFIPEALEKTKLIRSRLGENVRLEMDGGINDQTAAAVREAGCDVIVAASALFSAQDKPAMVRALRGG